MRSWMRDVEEDADDDEEEDVHDNVGDDDDDGDAELVVEICGNLYLAPRTRLNAPICFDASTCKRWRRGRALNKATCHL